MKKGIDDGVRMKKPGGSKSSITDENKEIILSALFNDPHIFGYLRNTWSLRSLASVLLMSLIFQSASNIYKELLRIWVLDVRDQNWNYYMDLIMKKEKKEWRITTV